MKNLPHDHDAFAAALPEMREHFEQAAVRSGDYAFVLESIADDLRRAEKSVATNGVTGSATALNSARQTLVAIWEAADFGALAGDLSAASAIAQKHQKKLQAPEA